ncbi:hypothetical protein PanWU01x14_098190 [Parasponia andersonii]|uniref:TOD1/MUCI70 glycosyltransferase-like domain-containing protein n=1 Tax=Parasponia andersonii TaxID=3476 RepID=A0A2P5D449_PARAD|nr:hypothetical protein PanWU01x14_098190 [Parasponia andersonii]
MIVRKSSKLLLSSSREKEKLLPLLCRFLGRRKVAMLLLVILALFVFISGSFTVSKENSNVNVTLHIENVITTGKGMPGKSRTFPGLKEDHDDESSTKLKIRTRSDRTSHMFFPHHHHHFHPKLSTVRVPVKAFPSVNQCEKFAFPPPPPANPKRIGPRPCPVCYLPVEQAVAMMPSSPSVSPVVQSLTYILDENPTRTELFGGSEFGGYPSLKQRDDSFDVKESMKVHCGFVKGSKPGYQTGFDIDEADLAELEQSHEVIVASAIFGNYDIIQQPKNVSDLARKKIPFYMFIDEETEAYLKNSSVLVSGKWVGMWRIIVVRNIPYNDSRRNGKIPKLLLHRLFPSVRYSIWIDGKLQLVVDPYQVLERFLWRHNATFAISRHYRRYDVFEEAEANKAAGKYDNASIDRQIEFYRKEGLKPYSKAKLPITSDVPEGCAIIREHIPITNLFTCLWFNEVDRFTSRDQLSFSTVRDKLMEKVGWSVNMFLDCERRNFVIQKYHRELLEQMPPPAVRRFKPVPSDGNTNGRALIGKKAFTRRGRERKSGSKRHRKVTAGGRYSYSF